VRHLATGDTVPEDVTVSVFTPARTELIDRTLDSVAGRTRSSTYLGISTAATR